MKIAGGFRDTVQYDAVTKTVVSVRDGVLEYLGSEIGMQPGTKIFKVFRSPATIANAAQLMREIPITNDHVDLDTTPQTPVGKVKTSKLIDLDQPGTQTCLGVLNTVEVDGGMQAYLDAGKDQLSLGYHGDLIPAPMESNFDLEQINILPHHLAIVDKGRCGSVCSFIDHAKSEGIEDMTKKPETKQLHKAFVDASGAPSLTDIVAIAQGLPEALKTLPVDELMKVMPTLQGIVKSAGGAAGAGDDAYDGDDEGGEGDDETMIDKDKTEGDTGAGDPGSQSNPNNAPGKGKKPAFGDSQKFKDAVAAGVKAAIKEGKEFKDAVKKATDEAVDGAIKRHVAVMDKARKFLPEDYKFDGKTTGAIMKDAVATEHGKQQFSDSELEVAFKMLKKSESPSRYAKFGDAAATGRFTSAAEKDL